MGQYHYVCNLDRKEFLHPHRMGDGFKLLEFGCSGDGVMTGLAILLVTSNGRGGGDLSLDADRRGELIAEYVVGRWAGDRIAIIGDYHEPGDVPGFTDKLVAETGGYNPDATSDEDRYSNPLVGDVPWNQTIKGTKDTPRLDLGWIDISDVVIEAMSHDSYLKQSIEKSQTLWGGARKPISKLDDNGQIIRLVQNM